MLLLSTVSWTVDKHLCMGRVIDVALFTKAKDCGMDAAMKVLGDDSVENHCCDDESFTMQGQDDLKLTWNDLHMDNLTFLAVFSHTYFQLFTATSEREVPLDIYPPPLLVKDIQLLDAVFLI